MTVKELREFLSAYSDDVRVYVRAYELGCDELTEPLIGTVELNDLADSNKGNEHDGKMYGRFMFNKGQSGTVAIHFGSKA